MRYNERSVEEIQPVIDLYFKGIKDRSGSEPNKDAVCAKLISLAEEKERAAFLATFESFSPQALRTAVKLIQSPHASNENVTESVIQEKAHVEERQEAKRPKGNRKNKA